MHTGKQARAWDLLHTTKGENEHYVVASSFRLNLLQSSLHWSILITSQSGPKGLTIVQKDLFMAEFRNRFQNHLELQNEKLALQHIYEEI